MKILSKFEYVSTKRITYRFFVPFLALLVIDANAQYIRERREGINQDDTTIIYKSKIILKYAAEDSTMANKSLFDKETYYYTENGQLLRFLLEGTNGNKFEETKNRYNANGKPIGGATYIYNSGHKRLHDSDSYKYDSLGRCVQHIHITRENKWTNYEDSGWMDVSTERNIYTKSGIGHLEITTDDSAGIAIYSMDSTEYDANNRQILCKHYFHHKLAEIDSTIYDSKGCRTEINELYDKSITYPYSTSVISEKSKSIWDKDDKSLSYEDIKHDSTETTVTKNATSYKYENGKLVSEITMAIETGKSTSEKFCTKQTFRYDEKGNKIESTFDDGAGASITKYEYNDKNKETKETTHEKGISKPTNYTWFTYFPGDTAVKEIQNYSPFSYGHSYNTITRYNTEKDVIEDISYVHDAARENAYTYEYWKKH
jgi:hypothetical protein